LTFYLAGTLPAGLSFDYQTGVISGTPTTIGRRTVRVRAYNGGGSDEIELTIEISQSAPIIMNAATYQATVGVDFNLQISASHQPGAFDLRGAIPPGISYDRETGTLSGRPTADGDWNVWLHAYNGAGTGSKYVTLKVGVPAGGSRPVFVGARNFISKAGQFTCHDLKVRNQPTAVTLISGSLPPGFSLSQSSGLLSGTPTTPGQYKAVFRGANSLGSLTHSATFHVGTETAPYAYRPNAAFYFDKPWTPSRWNFNGSGSGVASISNYTYFLGGGYGNRQSSAKPYFTVNLKDHQDVRLTCTIEHLGDDVSPASADGEFPDGDGIFMSVDNGRTYVRLRDVSNNTGRRWISIDLSAEAARRNLVLSENTRIRFSVTSNNPRPYRGRAIDNLNITSSTPSASRASGGTKAKATEAAPEGGEVLMLSAVDGEVAFTMPANNQSVVATSLTSDAVVTDVTDPENPIVLKVPLLESSGGHAAYFSVAAGRSVHIY